MDLLSPLNNKISVDESLSLTADKLVNAVQNIMRSVKNEEDLKIGFEKQLEPLCQTIDVNLESKYERSIYRSGRVDAMHGALVIEYKKPHEFRNDKKVEDAYSQICRYLTGLSKEKKDNLFITKSNVAGVGFDGESIFFVVYSGDITVPKTELDIKDFVKLGSYKFNSLSARTLLTYLRSLARKMLNSENITDAFGPQSIVANKIVSALTVGLKQWDNQYRAQTFFNEWKRLFGIVYGEQFNSQQEKELQAIIDLYKPPIQVDIQHILFVLHTYYVLLIKLITVDYLYVPESSFISSYSHELSHCPNSKLKEKLGYIEEGGIYNTKGISNFLEGDFFRWYLYTMWPGLEDALREMARALTDFEPSSPVLNPELIRDLLKRIYQSLIPRVVRHKLGEYYTPDWLAEFILSEIGYNGNTGKRILDPACGTGTFLVLAIRRAIVYGKKHHLKPIEILKKISKRIWGFDLNPLAVLAARTNYLLALGNLIDESTQIEIPIYLADSVLWPEQRGQMELGPAGGEYIPIPTSTQTFNIPRWLKSDWQLRIASEVVESLVKQQTPTSEAVEVLKERGLLFPPNEQVISLFYEQLLHLEQSNKNGIWARFLKNLSAPMIAGNFDYVVGNPPWIRWDYLSQEYRRATLEMWKDYGLFSLKGFETRLGGGKKDFSMLFTYAAADYYLSKNGKLGFLITQEVFKAKGAGEGFRHFRLGKKGKPLKMLKAHDFTAFKPFEDAANKTAAFVLTKGEETSYPVPYYVWSRKVKGAFLTKSKLNARPHGKPTGAWQTMNEEQERLNALKGECAYTAVLGANPNPYGVFWLEIQQVLANGNIIVRNLAELGKIEFESKPAQIEPDLVYPALRGSDIKRWKGTPQIYMLVTQDPEFRRGYPEPRMRSQWTRTMGYLLQFKRQLLERPLFKKYYKRDLDAFYSQFNISEKTFSPYKVVWKRMSNDIVSCVISTFKTPIDHKKVVPFETTTFIALDNPDESHFLCSILNSNCIREYIKTFSSSGRGFGSPSILKHIGIPKYNSRDEIHRRLSELSRLLHDHVLKGENGAMRGLEVEVDSLVEKMFRIG